MFKAEKSRQCIMYVFRIFLLLVWIGFFQGSSSLQLYNDASVYSDCQVIDKVDCAEDELPDKLTAERCEFLGCCWEEDPGSPYCFHKGGNCQDHQCVPGQGVCKASESGYTCQCHYPYYGEFCQHSNYTTVCPTQRDQCHTHDVIDVQCQGLGCCWQEDDCFHSDDNPHGPDGYCSNIDSTEQQECGYYGIWRDECWERGCCWHTRTETSWCFIPDRCSSNPCQNGGTCQNDEGNYVCDCVSPFAGINCDIGPSTTPDQQATTITTTTPTPTTESTAEQQSTHHHKFTTPEHLTTAAKRETTVLVTTDITDVPTTITDTPPDAITSEVPTSSIPESSSYAPTTEVHITTEEADIPSTDSVSTSATHTTVESGPTIVSSNTKLSTGITDIWTTSKEIRTSFNGKVSTEIDPTTQDRLITTLGHKETTGIYSTIQEMKTTSDAETTESHHSTAPNIETTLVAKPATSMVYMTTEIQPTTSAVGPSTKITIGEVYTTADEVESTKGPATTLISKSSSPGIVTSQKPTSEVPKLTSLIAEDSSTALVHKTTTSIETTAYITKETSSVHLSTTPRQTSETPTTSEETTISLSTSPTPPSTTTTPDKGGGEGGQPGELPAASFPVSAVVIVMVVFVGIIPCTIGMIYAIGKMNDKKKKPLKTNSIFPEDFDVT